MSKIVLPGQTIGIIGGGHMSRMLVLSAKQMGFKVGILDPSADCAASYVADWQIIASINDAQALVELSDRSDVLTYEYENVNIKAMEFLEEHVYMPQGIFGLSVTQDRLLEREFLNSLRINIAPYTTATLVSDIREAAQFVGYPCLVKSNIRNGQADKVVQLNGPDDVDQSVPLIQQGVCVVEAYVPLKKELFVAVGLNRNGDYSLFPIVETYHDATGALRKVKAPIIINDLPDVIVNQIHIVAKAIASELNASGIVGIEFFLTEDNNLYVNEVSTRPHEIGLYTMDACNFSEYDVHVRGICNWPIPKIKQHEPAISFNVTLDNEKRVLELLSSKRDWHYHHYESLAKRDEVRGHVTILSENIDEKIQELKHIKLIKN